MHPTPFISFIEPHYLSERNATFIGMECLLNGGEARRYRHASLMRIVNRSD